MDKETLIKLFKVCRQIAERNQSNQAIIKLTKDELTLLINNLEAVDKLKNEIKMMVEEKLTEVCNEIAELKVENNSMQFKPANFVGPVWYKSLRF